MRVADRNPAVIEPAARAGTIEVTGKIEGHGKLALATTDVGAAVRSAHLVMVVVAMIFVALMAFRALAGQESRRQHDGISAAALFWYTTVVVYSVIWLAVYVTK